MPPEAAPLSRATGLALGLAIWATGALAEGLDGRIVTFEVLTYDDPAAPLFRSSAYTATVGPGPEFGLLPETGNGLEAVTVTVDFSSRRLDIGFENTFPAVFAPAVFNGYVLTFTVDCLLIEGAALDPAATTLPLGPGDVTVTPRSLLIDVGGLAHTPEDRIGLTLDVTDCLMG